ELGLRSAAGSLAAPWLSPEQRKAPVDTALQARVLSEWRKALDVQGIAGVALWCWYTDPEAGGPDDSDFTVQHKPAQQVLAR
ncbi:glycosidase-like protein, partial [Xanthomonas sp. Kuri4-2]